MSGTAWPRVLDMSEDNARKTLRTLELAAYSSLVATFRAQGDLTAEKRKLLQQLKELLSITNERHRGELRRCVNDEKLSTIAYHMVGPNHDNEWLIEGRRLAPLSQRLALHTAFTSAANQAVAAQMEKNTMLPNPNQTGSREQFTAAGTLLNPPQIVQTAATSPGLSSPGYLSSTAPVTKYSRPQSPNTNVVILPSGTSIHIKGNVGAEEEEDITGTKRRRLASTDTTLGSTKQIVGRGQSAPLKLSLNNKTSQASSSSQKVILVQSSSGQTITASSAANVRKTAANSTVPIVKSVTPIISHTRTSVVYPATTSSDIVTTQGPTIHTHQGLTIQRPRAKATLTTTPRITTGGVKPSITVSRHGVVIPANSSCVTSRSGVHVKQEGAMKIITSSNNRLLPRPSTANSTPIVVVTSSTAGASGRISSPSPNRNTVITAGAGAVAINNKVISIHAAGKLINSSPSQKSTGQKVAPVTAKSASAGGSTASSHTITTSTGKSGNVVIVQQPRQTGTLKSSVAGTVMGSKEFVSFIHRHGTSSVVDKTFTSSSASVPTTIKALPTSPVSLHRKHSSDLPKTTYLSANSKSQSQVIVTPISEKCKGTPAPSSSVTTTPSWLSTADVYTTASSIIAPTASVAADSYTPVISSPPKMDIFSSALAEADINLDPYEFIDEDEPVAASTVTTPTSSIDEPPQWSTSGMDNSSGLFHLSQGAAILSGEMPYLPATTSSSDKTSPSYVETASTDDSVIDTATSLLAQASSMLAQTTRVHTPPASASNPTTCANLAPLGSQTILPKGKELIRILPVMAGTGSLVTSSSMLATRPHLTIQSRTSSSPNSRHVDIQPRGGDLSSPPFIDTKILILPQGIAQPSTPVKEPSAELVDTLVQTTNDSEVSTSLLNFTQVSTSLQQQQTNTELQQLESPVLDAKLVASLQQIGCSAANNEVVVSTGGVHLPAHSNDSLNSHIAFRSVLESAENVCSTSDSSQTGQGMISLLTPSNTTESGVYERHDQTTATSKDNCLQESKTFERNISLKTPKYSWTPRSNVLPWEKEAETSKDIEKVETVEQPEATTDTDHCATSPTTLKECTLIESVTTNTSMSNSTESNHATTEPVHTMTSFADNATSISAGMPKATDHAAQPFDEASLLGEIIEVSHTATVSAQRPSNEVNLEQLCLSANVVADEHDSFQDLVSELAPTNNDMLEQLSVDDRSIEAGAGVVAQSQMSAAVEDSTDICQSDRSTSVSMEKVELHDHSTGSPPISLDEVSQSQKPVETYSAECDDLPHGSIDSPQAVEVPLGSDSLFQDRNSSVFERPSHEGTSNPLLLDSSISHVQSNSDSTTTHSQTYSASSSNDSKTVISPIPNTVDLSSQPVTQLFSDGESTINEHKPDTCSVSGNVDTSFENISDSAVLSGDVEVIQNKQNTVHGLVALLSNDNESMERLEGEVSDTNQNVEDQQSFSTVIVESSSKEEIAIVASDIGNRVGEGEHGESSDSSSISRKSPEQGLSDLKKCRNGESDNSDENQAVNACPDCIETEVIQEVETKTAHPMSTNENVSVVDTVINERPVNNVNMIHRTDDVVAAGLDDVSNLNCDIPLNSQDDEQLNALGDHDGAQPVLTLNNVDSINVTGDSVNETARTDYVADGVECSSMAKSMTSDIDRKSDDSLSDSSPPLIARRNFERVYRPRSSRTSTALSLDTPSPQDDNSPLDQTSSNSQSKTNGNDEVLSPVICSSTVVIEHEASRELNSEATEARSSKDSIALVNGRQSQELVQSIGLKKDNEAEDWLTDSGHSLSNDPTSLGDEESEEDENSNDMGIVSPGTEKVVRRGRKKRRRSDQSPSWSRAALGLLKRVMMFRGANRNKGEHGAAAWFLKPVSDDEAPGYSDIISQPMDFGTIKRKLEANIYPSVESFRSDMLLIHSNCCKYNPPEHNVRRDCELVFIYFRQEYEKLLARIQQVAAGSKKARIESDSSATS